MSEMKWLEWVRDFLRAQYDMLMASPRPKSIPHTNDFLRASEDVDAYINRAAHNGACIQNLEENAVASTNSTESSSKLVGAHNGGEAVAVGEVTGDGFPMLYGHKPLKPKTKLYIHPSATDVEDAKDAARYRYLLSHRFDYIVRNNGEEISLRLPGGWDYREDASVNQHIDEAIAHRGDNESEGGA